MKKIIPFLATAFTLIAVNVHAQTADDIISKYVNAIGGRDNLKQANSLYMEGVVNAMGSDNPTKVTILNGKGFKSESEFNGGKAVQCYNEKGGWMINPMGGGGAEPMPDESYQSGKEQMNIGGSLLNYAANGSSAQLEGKEADGYKVKMVSKDKTETTYYFDPASYLLTKLVRRANVMGQDTQITIQFSDYRKVDGGIMVPFAMNTDLGQFQLATTFKKVEVNKPVDPSIFNMPK